MILFFSYFRNGKLGFVFENCRGLKEFHVNTFTKVLYIMAQSASFRCLLFIVRISTFLTLAQGRGMTVCYTM